MLDLKVINAVFGQLEEERGIPKEKIIEAIEMALATAYKKEYGKKGQIVRATFDVNTGATEFSQVKIVVDENSVYMDPEDVPEVDEDDEEALAARKPVYNPEHHILIEDAKRIKATAEIDEELIFPLTPKDDFGRIASQTAKQVIIQKIREAEKVSVLDEYGEKEGQIVTGSVQRIERGNIFVDMGRATGLLAYDEQIPGERYRQGERVRAYLYRVDETPRGVFLRLSRSHPEFIRELFETEAPELSTKAVEIKAIAREAGSRSKLAVISNDDHIDPVGALVGQRGVRVSTVMSERGGERIDVIEWSEDPIQFIGDALSPAEVISVEILDEENREVRVEVDAEQQSLAIGKGGQNVRLAAKLTGWKIDITSVGGEEKPLQDSEEQNLGGQAKKDADAPEESEDKTEVLNPDETPEGTLTPEDEPIEDKVQESVHTETTPDATETKVEKTDETPEETEETPVEEKSEEKE